MESKLSKTDLIHKYAKYYYKAYQTGGSEPMKQSIYDIKLRDYGSQLSRSGFNLNKIHEVIQSGGALTDIINAIENQKKNLTNTIDANVNNLSNNVNDLKTRLQTITDKINELTTERSQILDLINGMDLGNMGNLGQLNQLNQDVLDMITQVDGNGGDDGNGDGTS